MRVVKQRPKYRCDFCRHTATKDAMERHERLCWKNPNRWCDTCGNTGRATVEYDYGMKEAVECWFCKQFDPMRSDPLSGPGSSHSAKPEKKGGQHERFSY